MNFTELEQKIERATKKAFIEIFEKYKDEEIYSFSLYSDEGAMTVCPSINTIDFLKNLGKEEDVTYYKFEPSEWKYEMVGANKEFNKISAELSTELEKSKYEDKKNFLTFRNILFSTCINILKKLRSEHFFKNITGKDIFLIFTVSDFEFDDKERENIVIELNDNNYQIEYLKWMKTWHE